MTYETILTENIDGVLLITINRPDRLNAWTYQMSDELVDAVTKANADEDILAMVVTGAGRGFCAGADIEAVFNAQLEGKDVTTSSDPRDWVALMRESKPMIAAVNGPAVGLGITLILPMDYLIASTEARLSVRFVKLGIVPELASSHLLTLRVGFGHASELLLTGKVATAEEALEIGLVDKLVSPEELIPAALEMARRMGENAQTSIHFIKQLLTQNACETDLSLIQKREISALMECYKSEEHKEAIDAFMNKRAPDFKAARNREKQ